MKKKLVYFYVQEGGATGELYFHSFNTRRQAEKGKEKAEADSYRTSEVGEVPRDFAEHTAFEDFADVLLNLVGDLC